MQPADPRARPMARIQDEARAFRDAGVSMKQLPWGRALGLLEAGTSTVTGQSAADMLLQLDRSVVGVEGLETPTFNLLVRGLRAMLRDLRARRVGEPRPRSEREDATLSLGRAAAELAGPYGHVASQNVCAGAGLDDDHLMPIRVPGRRQQADSR